MAEKCCCGGPARLIFPCAGGSDVGELTDRVARKLTKDGWGRIYCLAGVAAHIKNFIENSKMAEEIVAIDGCPAACASKALIHAGFQPVAISLKEAGFLKGHSPVNEENICKLVDFIKATLKSEVCIQQPDSKQGDCCCDEK